MAWLVRRSETAVVGDGERVMNSYMELCGEALGGGSAGGRQKES